MTQENRSNGQPDPEWIQVRRNPYLADYHTGKNTGRHARRRIGQPQGGQTEKRASQPQGSQTGKRTAQLQGGQTGRNAEQTQDRQFGKSVAQSQGRIQAMPQEGGRKRTHPQHPAMAQQENRIRQHKQRHPGRVYEQNAYPDNTYSTRGRQRRARAERQRRRRQDRIRRYLRLSLLCASILVGIVVLKNLLEASASTPVEAAAEMVQQMEKQIDQTTGTRIQGLPTDVYAAHPNWTEDFLTVNEYSRPGDPLPEVKNIFVHYTANPGTSAAQNRSYFEQLKDNHERSASAHLIIGYNGEILQCVPLDEIAYAVQTRNEDSISIECCYKAENGQFTQETYDSLIKLLKWLTDAYDLEPDDILRHYDCGGKKCPIYYTEHEDAWNQVKEDVKNL